MQNFDWCWPQRCVKMDARMRESGLRRSRVHHVPIRSSTSCTARFTASKETMGHLNPHHDCKCSLQFLRKFWFLQRKPSQSDQIVCFDRIESDSKSLDRRLFQFTTGTGSDVLDSVSSTNCSDGKL